MKTYIYFLFFGIITPSILIGQTRETDSLNLVAIYETLDGHNWPKNENWLSDRPLDDWEGIRMVNDRVQKLELKSNGSVNISGDFPLQILELSELETLELSYIDISNELPTALVQLTKLSRIVLSNCNLSGDLPPIFNQFEFLSTLVLSNNQFTGSLPDLPSDMYLVYVDNNHFSGSIPESWEASQISALQIHQNQLSGDYNLLSTLPNIRSIDLSDNDWDEANIPLWIDDLPNLERFACNNCNIKGEIPQELDFSALQNYSGMFLSDNDLTGDITPLFNNPIHQEKLYLRLRNNKLSGELPLDKIVSFFQLDVYNNDYTSLAQPIDGAEYRLNIQYNNFDYQSLTPVESYIALDSIILVNYTKQSKLGQPDTLYIEEATTVTLSAYDSHPSTQYQWYKNNVMLENETSMEISLTILDNKTKGNYHCKMTNPSFPNLDLSTHDIMIDVDITTSTIDLPPLIDLYPNPASTHLNINNNNNSKNHSYKISDIRGQQILMDGKSVANRIDVLSLSPGLYILHLQIDGHWSARKFIKI